MENGPRVFWGEIAPYEHIVQFYENDAVFLDMLAAFVSDGLAAGESTIVIATSQHLRALGSRLTDTDANFFKAMSQDRYIALSAETTLLSFMVGNWPDDHLFAGLIERLLQRATRGNRKVRAFGEMVALLWAQGHIAATVRLEFLWHELCKSHSFPLLCAYPKAGFTDDPSHSFTEICALHSRVIPDPLRVAPICAC